MSHLTKARFFGNFSPHTATAQTAGHNMKSKASASTKAKRHHLSSATGFGGS